MNLDKNIFNLINKIENEVKKSFAFRGKAICDKRKLLENIAKLRKVLQDHEKQLVRSEQDINKKLKEEIEKRVRSSEIVEQARQEAHRIISSAEREAQEIREWARSIASKIFKALEEELEKVLSRTRELRMRVNERVNEELTRNPMPKKQERRELTSSKR